MSDMDNELLNCQKAAQYLGVSVKTIRQWAQSGKLEGQKIGPRGDWRFTEDHLSKMIRVEKDKYQNIREFLLDNAEVIQQSANKKHIDYLGTEDAKLQNLAKNHADYVAIVKELAHNLENLKKGKLLFERLGIKLAKKSIAQGLTLEETIDGTIFLKQAFWEQLNKAGLLYKLTVHDFYHFNQVISTYTDIVASKIIFAYHDNYKSGEEQIAAAKAAQRAADDRFCILADNIHNLAWIAQPDGYIDWYNKRWYEYTGTSPKDMEGWGWQSVHDPKTLPHVMKRWQASIDTGEPFDMTFPLRGADGIFRPFLTRVMPVKDKSGAIVHWTGTNTDISEQILAEEALRESEKRFSTVFESVLDGISVFDMKGNIILLNSAQATINGYKNADEMKKDLKYFASVYQLKYPDGTVCPIPDWPISRVYRGETFSNFELHGKRTDIGRQWVFSFSGVPVCDDTGNPVLAVVVTRDITIQKQAEAEQKQLVKVSNERNELLKINKAKDEFIGIASHQLRTPATAVKQYIGLLLSGYGGEMNEQQHSFLQTAYASNERQLKLLNDLLKTAQIDSDNYKLDTRQHMIRQIIQEVADDLKPLYDLKKQKLVIKELTKNVEVRVDDTEMKMVLSNLLENASKYSYEATEINISLKKLNNKLLLSITDSGVGIPKEDSQRIFDKFTRVDNELSDTITGTGLGLYLVKQLVELHGGKITVLSKPNIGSTFTITLPL